MKLLHADPKTLSLIPDDELPARFRLKVGAARKTVLISIPPGAHEHQCTCGDFIFFALHPSTKNPHPVSLKHDLAIRPTSTTCGQGVSHVPECPHRDFHLGKTQDRRFFERRFKK